MIRRVEFFLGAWAGCAAVLTKMIPLAGQMNTAVYCFAYAGSLAMTWFFLLPRGKWSVIGSLGTLAVFAAALALTASGDMGLVAAIIGGALAYLGILVALAVRHAVNADSVIVGIVAGALTTLPAVAYIAVVVSAS